MMCQSKPLLVIALLGCCAALKPAVGRDHHYSDKASLISSGNVDNLVVFKDDQLKEHYSRKASLRQAELLDLHDR